MKEKEARNRISKAVLHLCPQNSKTTKVKMNSNRTHKPKRKRQIKYEKRDFRDP